MSHWLHKGEILQEVPESWYGFIYIITNNLTGKKYIGKKIFGKTRRKKVAGKTRRKVVRTESDWKDYTGSSIPLNADIAEYGKENFKFEIICFARTKGQLNFLECDIQHKYNVLTTVDNSNNRMFYNDCIGSKKFIGIRFTDELLNTIRTMNTLVY